MELLGGFEPPTSSLPNLLTLSFLVVSRCLLFFISVGIQGFFAFSSRLLFSVVKGSCGSFSGVRVSFYVSFMAFRKIREALFRLSSLAWVYIRKVIAVSLCPNASDTLATSAPAVIATLAKVCRSLCG